MQSHHDSRILHHIAAGSGTPILDVAGLTVEFLTGPQDAPRDFCVMRGVIPPGAVVPIHSHDSTEAFLVISGTKQALVPGEDGLEWKDVHEGDYVQIASGEAHALRNVSREPVIELIITNPRLGEWFSEAGRPVTGEPGPPTPEDLARLIAVSGKYGYRLGTPDENRAVGIELPRVT
jgi:quercetin dioxygenase-like cupin family protein